MNRVSRWTSLENLILKISEFEFLGVGGIQASEKDSIKENKRGNQEKSENAKNVDIYNKSNIKF